MFLFKVELELDNRTVHLIVVAEKEEDAFAEIEANVARHYIASPSVKQATILEKKRIHRGAGYIIDTQETVLQ